MGSLFSSEKKKSIPEEEYNQLKRKEEELRRQKDELRRQQEECNRWKEECKAEADKKGRIEKEKRWLEKNLKEYERKHETNERQVNKFQKQLEVAEREKNRIKQQYDEERKHGGSSEKLSQQLANALEEIHNLKKQFLPDYIDNIIDMNGFETPDKIMSNFVDLGRNGRLNFLESIEDDVLPDADDETLDLFATIPCQIILETFAIAQNWLKIQRKKVEKKLHSEGKEYHAGHVTNYLQMNYKDMLPPNDQENITQNEKEFMNECLNNCKTVASFGAQEKEKLLEAFFKLRGQCIGFCCTIVLASPPYELCCDGEGEVYNSAIQNKHPESENGKYVEFYVWPYLRNSKKVAGKGLVFLK